MRSEAPYIWMRLLWISMIAPVVGTYWGGTGAGRASGYVPVAVTLPSPTQRPFAASPWLTEPRGSAGGTLGFWGERSLVFLQPLTEFSLYSG